MIWIERGCFTHVIILLLTDKDITDSWFWNNFGLCTVDAIRELIPIEADEPKDVAIGEANKNNIDKLFELMQELKRYPAGPSILQPLLQIEDKNKIESMLSNEIFKIWVATIDGQIIGFIKAEIGANDAYLIVQDEKTISITGAYIKKDFRSRGIGKPLLKRVINWAIENGYERCSVDFESANIYGAQFWMKYFKPICYSLIRHVDERIAWANKDRKLSSFW